jgi:hypothetical protein
MAVQMASSIASMIRPHPGANWAAELDERDRQMREESERVSHQCYVRSPVRRLLPRD